MPGKDILRHKQRRQAEGEDRQRRNAGQRGAVIDAPALGHTGKNAEEQHNAQNAAHRHQNDLRAAVIQRSQLQRVLHHQNVHAGEGLGALAHHAELRHAQSDPRHAQRKQRAPAMPEQLREGQRGEHDQPVERKIASLNQHEFHRHNYKQ